MLRSFLDQFMRLRIIAKTMLRSSTDVRRMMRLACALRAAGASERTVCLLLLADRPLRDARISRLMLQTFIRKSRCTCSETQAAWSSIHAGIRRHRKYGSRSCFWEGPSALSAARMVSSLRRQSLVAVAEYLTASKSVDTSRAMAQLRSLNDVGSYHAYSTLRSLRAVMGLGLRAEHEAAGNMSPTVSMLTSLLPLREVMQTMRSHVRPREDAVNVGEAAMAVCETRKALTRFGLLAGGHTYPACELHARLASANAYRLLRALEACEPLSTSVIAAAGGLFRAEQQQLDACFPVTSETWDSDPHYAAGSYHLTSHFLPALRRRGWFVRRTSARNDSSAF